MNEVECGLAPFETAREGLGICKIRFANLHPEISNPFSTLQLARGADKAPNAIAGIKQARSETSANVASGSCDRDKLRFKSFNQVAPIFEKFRCLSLELVQ